MEFRPSKLSLISIQKLLLCLFTSLIPLTVLLVTQNKIFSGLCLILCVPVIYFWSIALFLQKITINGSKLFFHDPGAHQAHYLNKMKRISRSDHLFDLSTVENLFITIETSGNLKFISFFDSYTKLRESRKIYNLNLKHKEMFTIVGIWTENDLDKISKYIKKSNPHLKAVNVEFFL